jgi:hypothetical protein
MNSSGFANVLFSQEVAFWSVANYVLGSQFAIQQTPYGTKRMLSLASELYRRTPALNTVSADSLKKRDLYHRMRGAPVARSFQRQFLIVHDVKGRNVPINWGWLASGGYSPTWMAQAAQAAMDAAVVKWSGMGGWKKAMASAVPRALRRPYALVSWSDIVRHQLREFTNDLLRSSVVTTCGAFDAVQLKVLLDEHYRGTKNHHGALMKLLELGCAAAVLAE